MAPLALAGVALLAVVIGWVIARYGGFVPEGSPPALVVLASLGATAVIMAGPVPCLAAIAVLTVGTFGEQLAVAGNVGLAPADVFYAGLVAWWLRSVIGRAQQDGPDLRPRIAFGQVAAAIFFAYTALTFLHIASSDPGALENSLVSWLRFAQTASVAVIAASVIETKRDVRLVLGAIGLSALLAIALAAASGGSLLGGRAGGGAGPNTLGLLSGLLLLIAVFGAVTTDTRHRVVLGAAAIFGLLLAKSVGSFVATGIALATGAALMGSTGSAQRATRVALAIGLACVLVLGAVQVLRPEVSPASQEFRGSSASQRVLVAAAGIEVFERNPLIGAGWRQSSNSDVIGDREVGIEVRRRFPDARPIHYPDVNPTSVHNTYVQMLADLGLIGFGLFIGMIVAIAVRTRDLLRRADAVGELRREAWVMALGLLLLLVWLNETPLFGGQASTVIGALLIGTLAATSRIVPGSSAEPSPEKATRPPEAKATRPMPWREWKSAPGRAS